MTTATIRLTAYACPVMVPLPFIPRVGLHRSERARCLWAEWFGRRIGVVVGRGHEPVAILDPMDEAFDGAMGRATGWVTIPETEG